MSKFARAYLYLSGLLTTMVVLVMLVSWLTDYDYMKFYGLFDTCTDMILSGMVLVLWTEKGEKE